ncbi:RIP metalloprotease RseP [Pseudoprimorskyibacter insulae]|uniref:Zinc metalloprotease n=1 Tax=Pseudoprimorskyibacter insulae TaxID=1695997 RepID=A0A2R8AWW1_9RHOB|nr:RIP metalloprotease RseP [Pseudoprimorskyibacter insulae]SPF80369.1 Regulator of sigma-E protease RseP [Pseudoprimorskyibacter insulae]
MELTSLIPQFGGFVWTILAFVVALSIIVAIHEYGHYIVGRWSGIKADVFSLGFGPVLFSRYDKRGTRWQIAALPLGGYVKFRGDANASGGVDDAAMSELSEADKRATMPGAPLWARAATVAAGPVFNFALSIVIFSAVFLFRGVISEPLTVGDLRQLPVQQEVQAGDVLLEVDGGALPDFDSAQAFETFLRALPKQELLDYTVLRNDEKRVVQGPYPYPPIVTQVVPRSAAYEAGLEAGDVLTSIDGTPIFRFEQLRDAVEGSDGKTLNLTVWNAGTERAVDLTPKRTDEPQADGGFETVYRIGVVGGLFFDPATESTGLIDSIGGAFAQVWRIMSGSISGLWHMITGAISTCNLSGPIGIAETSGAMASAGTSDFIYFIAVLSTAVGLLNLFPIPVLDGGHLCFFAYEAATGKPPSDRAVNILMTIGLAIVLSLMVFSLSNDLFCP